MGMMSKKGIRIALCDDHPALRKGIISFLTPSMKCVLETSNLQELFQAYAQAKPDVVILDLNLSEHPGATTVSYVLSQLPDVKIVVYSMRDALPSIFASYGAGAKAFVSKASEIENLLDAIKAVAKNNTYFEPGRAEEMALFKTSSRSVGNPHDLLTPGEMDTLIAAAKGLSISKIADKLGISVKTVRNRLSLINNKLGIQPDNYMDYVIEHQLSQDL